MSGIARPIPAALAVLPRGESLLLARRSHPPDVGLWGYPGGKIERGETVAEAAVRELREETGLIARPREVLTCLDVLKRGPDAQVEHHYILIAVLCEGGAGAPVAADDISEAGWFPVADILAGRLPMSESVDLVARLALDRVGRD